MFCIWYRSFYLSELKQPSGQIILSWRYGFLCSFDTWTRIWIYVPTPWTWYTMYYQSPKWNGNFLIEHLKLFWFGIIIWYYYSAKEYLSHNYIWFIHFESRNTYKQLYYNLQGLLDFRICFDEVAYVVDLWLSFLVLIEHSVIGGTKAEMLPRWLYNRGVLT